MKDKTAPAASTEKKKSAKSFDIPFVLKNETKGAVRFQETDTDGEPLESADDGAIGTLYVRKSFLEENGIKKPEGCDIVITFRRS